MTEPESVGLKLRISGSVQGVGFRWWVQRFARRLGLSGMARNTSNGGVEVMAIGSKIACETLLRAVQGSEPPGLVRSVKAEWMPVAESGEPHDFRIE